MNDAPPFDKLRTGFDKLRTGFDKLRTGFDKLRANGCNYHDFCNDQIGEP